MSGSAGLWPIGPAANPANPAPPPARTSSASTGTILAHGLPCISTNMAKKNATPSASALARSSPSTSDMGTLRLIVAAVPTACRVALLPGLDQTARSSCSERRRQADNNTRVDDVHLDDTMVRAYAAQGAL